MKSLEQQMAFYAAYHRDTRNKLSHFIGVPLIVFGSTLILKLMERFPLIITAGAALLGWLAGEMMLTDPAIHRWFPEVPESAVRIAGVVGAVLVVIVGNLLQRRAKSRG